MSEIAQRVSRHWKHSLWIVVILALTTLLAMSLQFDTSMVEQLVVVVAFSLISSGSFVALSRHTVKRGGNSLIKSFLIHSTLRMLAAAATIFFYANVKGLLQAEDRKPLLTFVIIFAVFYLILLIFDAVRVMKWQGNIGHRE